jgi:radical SAM protein with 4Fe4S-binding SPASM domain
MSKTRTQGDTSAIPVVMGADSLHDATVRLAKDLPDVHHSTLLLSSREAASNTGVVSDLSRYLERVAELQRGDRLFEKLEVELNLGCNRRCSYCYLATDRRENYVLSNHGTMDSGLFELLIAQLVDLQGGGAICFHFYAEPLLNKRLGECTAWARKRLPRVQVILYTNGDFLTANRHQELTSAGVSLFFVTRHDNKIPSFLAPVLEEDNVVLDRRTDMVFNNRGGLLGRNADQSVRSLPCIHTSECLIVTIDGNVLPCSCDFRELHRFGNIRDTHIADIYRSETCRAFRRNLLAGDRAAYKLCRDCDFYCEVLGVPSAAETHREHEQYTLAQMRRIEQGPK